MEVIRAGLSDEVIRAGLRDEALEADAKIQTPLSAKLLAARNMWGRETTMGLAKGFPRTGHLA